MTDASPSAGSPLTAFDIAMHHGTWRDLHDASNAWNELLTYTQDLECKLAEAQGQVAGSSASLIECGLLAKKSTEELIAAEAECARLRAEVAHWRVVEQERDDAALALDAERYRWIRTRSMHDLESAAIWLLDAKAPNVHTCEEFDAAIDAALTTARK